MPVEKASATVGLAIEVVPRALHVEQHRLRRIHVVSHSFDKIRHEAARSDATTGPFDKSTGSSAPFRRRPAELTE